MKVRKQGFTIIELLAVMVIISILAAMMLGGAAYARRAARESKAKAQLEIIRSALNSYYLDWGFYPTTGGGEDADLDADFWRSLKQPDGQFYVRLNEYGFNYEFSDNDAESYEGYTPVLTAADTIDAVLDPFGEVWRYCVPGKRNTSSVDIWSKGLNQVDDSEDRDTDIETDLSDDLGTWKPN